MLEDWARGEVRGSYNTFEMNDNNTCDAIELKQHHSHKIKRLNSGRVF